MVPISVLVAAGSLDVGSGGRVSPSASSDVVDDAGCSVWPRGVVDQNLYAAGSEIAGYRGPYAA